MPLLVGVFLLLMSCAVSGRLSHTLIFTGLHGAEMRCPGKQINTWKSFCLWPCSCFSLAVYLASKSQTPIADRRLGTAQPCCGSAVSSWRCLSPAGGAQRRAAARAAEPEPRARRPATPPPSSLLARSFRTDRYLWSERARGGWERSRRLLRHGGVQVLIGQISLSGDKRVQPPTRAGEPAAQRDRR